MTKPEISVVTGAVGYTGKYITQRLLSLGGRVKTLAGHPDRPHPFGTRVDAAPLSFDEPSALVRDLEGAYTLYNTYWIRFPRGSASFDHAVRNSRVLIRAAAAGVRRLVHISIANASRDSDLPYFRCKGLVEEAVRESGLSHSIVRPTLVFGKEDMLMNNIAWGLRRFPLFPIFGKGDYHLRPVYVGDVARIAVDGGAGEANETVDAVGPERFTFEEMVRLIGTAVGARSRLVHTSPVLALGLTRVLGTLMKDVVLTSDEIKGLMAGLLDTTCPPTGTTELSTWLQKNSAQLGAAYVSEVRRNWG